MRAYPETSGNAVPNRNRTAGISRRGVMSTRRHGLARYLNDGCRCDKCTFYYDRALDGLDRFLAGDPTADIAATWGVSCQAVQQQLRLATGVDDLRILRPRVVCEVEGCDETAVGRTWCQKHYQRWQRHGDPLHERTLREPELCPVDEPPADGVDSREWTYDWTSVAKRCAEQPGQWFRIDDDVPRPGLVHSLKSMGLDAVWRAGRVYVRDVERSEVSA